MKGVIGLACSAVVCALLVACAGTYQHQGRCYEYEQLPDGTKRWSECDGVDTWHYETKSWREILSGSRSLDTVHYYYETKMVVDGVVVHTWTADNCDEFIKDLPEMIAAVGASYTQAEFDAACATLKANWVPPETDYKRFNP